jgi:hypothetical protein
MLLEMDIAASQPLAPIASTVQAVLTAPIAPTASTAQAVITASTAPTASTVQAVFTAPVVPVVPKQLSPDRPEVLIQAYLAERYTFINYYINI